MKRINVHNQLDFLRLLISLLHRSLFWRKEWWRWETWLWEDCIREWRCSYWSMEGAASHDKFSCSHQLLCRKMRDMELANQCPRRKGCTWVSGGSMSNSKDCWAYCDWKWTSGKGFLETKSGDKYEGDWKAGLEDGNGVFTWSDGTKYTGELREGAPHGTGNMEYEDKIYKGGWNNGKREGKGMQIYWVKVCWNSSGRVVRKEDGKVLLRAEWLDDKPVR